MPYYAENKPTKGQVFIATLYSLRESDFQSFLEAKLKLKIIDSLSSSPSSMIDYYQKEMGGELQRGFFLVEGKREKIDLVSLKKETMDLERSYANTSDKKRVFNLDPGLLCPEQALLISTKPYSHRIYAGDHLYWELLYVFENKSYRPLPWTYPEYCKEELIGQFSKWRNISN